MSMEDLEDHGCQEGLFYILEVYFVECVPFVYCECQAVRWESALALKAKGVTWRMCQQLL